MKGYQKIKKIFSYLVLTLLTSMSLMTSPVMATERASFNNMEGDYEFLRGVNITQGGSEYTDPVIAKAGEVIKVIIYYHNTSHNQDGSAGVTALNTKIRTKIIGSDSGKFIVNGELWADNADKITGTFINGQELGQPGLTVDSQSPLSKIDFVSGSVKWYPNRSTTPVALPFGQSGDEIMTDNGLRLGDIQGCWQYAGFLTFNLKLSGQAASFSRSKSAWNETQRVDATTKVAKAGDIIRYNLSTKNNSSVNGQTAIFDDISDILEYAEMIDLGGGTLGADQKINFGQVNIDANQTVDHIFKVKVKDPLPTGGDFRMSNTYGNLVEVNLERPVEYGAPILKIKKEVRNVTRNTDFSTGASANPGDTLEYRITVRNHHGTNPAFELRLKDIIDGHIVYIAGSGWMDIAGQKVSLPTDIFQSSGYLLTRPVALLGPVGQYDTLVIYFTARVADNAEDDHIYMNKACTSARLHGEVCYEVPTQVQIEAIPPQPESPELGVTPPVENPQRSTIPTTGPADLWWFILGLSSSAAAGSHYFLSKRLLRDVARRPKSNRVILIK